VQGQSCQWRNDWADRENARRSAEIRWELWSSVDLLRELGTGEIRESERFWDKKIADRYERTEGVAERWRK